MAAAAALAQLGALRFAVSTEGTDNASPCASWTTLMPAPLLQLTWSDLQEEAAVQQRVNTTSRLWLQPAHDAWSGVAGRRGSDTCLADVSAPLLPALLGEAPLPGLSAVAPACEDNLLPKARTLSTPRRRARPQPCTTFHRPTQNPTHGRRRRRARAAPFMHRVSARR
jgi:hypothetical protein